MLTLGRQEGQDNNVVEATFAENTGNPAAFLASARAPGDPANTRISGVVLDNSNHPIPGVTMRVFRTNTGPGIPEQVTPPAPTDAQGQFTILPAPVGTFKLMADGATSTVGAYPSLEFDITTVAGQNNDVGLPIYLPNLDTVNRLCVNETTGGTLTLPQVPGFSLTIAAGAATFPGGSRAGCVTVTPVNGDKVPMSPGFGQQPRFVVTIQPVGTTFNPPAALTLPNVDGLAPRQVTEMYSYDHDLASFVAIGTGTVSEDGLVIRSDPGVGVLKAGWHCGGDPNSTGSAGTCPICSSCQGTLCVSDNSQVPTQNAAGDCKREICSSGAVITVNDDSDAPPPGAPGACTTSVCSGGAVVQVPTSGTPPQNSPNDCKQEVCSQGAVASIPDDTEHPADLCQKCSAGETIARTDMGETPPSSVGPPLNYLPIVSAGTPPGWGLTVINDPVFDITPYCDASGVAKADITQADSQIEQSVRLLPGVTEVTDTLISTTNSCDTLTKMRNSLANVANQDPPDGYYVLAAVQAHEDVHVTQYKAAIAPAYVTLKSTVESLSVPLDLYPNAGAAKIAIQALPAYTTAMATFHAADVAANDATASESPEQPFIDAEWNVVQPFITQIDQKRLGLNCP